MPHAPFEHVAVPFVLSHTLPQALQFVGLVFRLVSQPLAASLSQLP